MVLLLLLLLFCVRSAGTLTFTDKTPADAQELVLRLLHPDGPQRVGFKKVENQRSMGFYAGVTWDNLYAEMKQYTSTVLSEATHDLALTAFSDYAHMADAEVAAFEDW